MTFQEWWKENAVELNESYSKQDMEWIAEKAWGYISAKQRAIGYSEGANDMHKTVYSSTDKGNTQEDEQDANRVCDYCGEPFCSKQACEDKADEKALGLFNQGEVPA